MRARTHILGPSPPVSQLLVIHKFINMWFIEGRKRRIRANSNKVYIRIHGCLCILTNLSTNSIKPVLVAWQPCSTSCKMTNNRWAPLSSRKMETKRKQKKNRIFWTFEQSGNAVEAEKKISFCQRTKVGFSSKANMERERGRHKYVQVHRGVLRTVYSTRVHVWLT